MCDSAAHRPWRGSSFFSRALAPASTLGSGEAEGERLRPHASGQLREKPSRDIQRQGPEFLRGPGHKVGAGGPGSLSWSRRLPLPLSSRVVKGRLPGADPGAGLLGSAEPTVRPSPAASLLPSASLLGRVPGARGILLPLPAVLSERGWCTFWPGPRAEHFAAKHLNRPLSTEPWVPFPWVLASLALFGI